MKLVTLNASLAIIITNKLLEGEDFKIPAVTNPTVLSIKHTHLLSYHRVMSENGLPFGAHFATVFSNTSRFLKNTKTTTLTQSKRKSNPNKRWRLPRDGFLVLTSPDTISVGFRFPAGST